MKRFVPSWLAILGATALLTLAAAPAAVAEDVTYSFSLLGPQTATNGTQTTGQTIAVTGAGSFDPDAKTVIASGAFEITDNSTGAVVRAGTWKATAFNTFCPRGGPNSGIQGGVLVITVTLSPVGGSPITGVRMTIICAVGTGCSVPAKDVITVTEVAGFSDFTTVVRAANLFHLNQ